MDNSYNNSPLMRKIKDCKNQIYCSHTKLLTSIIIRETDSY